MGVTLQDALRHLLEKQADVEPYGDGTVVITGPVDLEELAVELAKMQVQHHFKWPPVHVPGACATTRRN